jgi:hypothetical protein
MTAPTAQQFIARLRRDIGYEEDPPGTNCNRYSKALHRPCESWCADTLVATAHEMGLTLPPGADSAYTPSMAAAFKKAGKLGTQPRVGAWTFWKFHSGAAPVQHVSCLATWDPNTVTTLDGNTSIGSYGSQADGLWVAQRTRSRTLVVEYGYPDYATDAHQPPTQAPPALPWVGTPTHYPEDNMDRHPVNIAVNGGRGYADLDVDVNSVVAITPFGGNPSDGWDPSPAQEAPYAVGLKPGQCRIVLPKSGIAKGTVAAAVWTAA